MTTVSQQSPFGKALGEATQLLESLRSLEPQLEQTAESCIQCLEQGHKILVCGNGGSASEAQHFVGELMGRYIGNRQSLAAVALNADSTTLSCIANDYCFEEVFSRQVRGLGRTGDVLVVFSTSGNSSNIIRALESARTSKIKSFAFLGGKGGLAAPLADCSLIVQHAQTARIQEGHQFLTIWI